MCEIYGIYAFCFQQQIYNYFFLFVSFMINMCRFDGRFFTWYGQKHLLYTLVKVCMRASIPFCLLVSCVVQSAVAQELVYSFAEAKEHLLRASNVLKVAAAEEQIARKEQEKASSLWWPHIQADGMYAHLSERVEVRQPLSRYTDPAKAYIRSIFPSEQLLSGLLDEVGQYTFTFPLLPENISSVGLTAEWVAYSGGKRILADRLSRRLVDVAQMNGRQVYAAEQLLLVERYYGLVLAEQTVRVCQEHYNGARAHYEHAVKLESVGMIDKAARLLAQVNMREAKRELDRALNTQRTGQLALKELLGIADDSIRIVPSSPLFMNTQMPMEMVFQEAMRSHNPTLGSLHIEESMATDKLRIDYSAYLPEIAIFGKQTLYAQGLPSNLLPRTIVGVGFTWNLFDGLQRERQIAQTRIARQSVTWSLQHAESQLSVLVTELYSTMQQAIEDVEVLKASIALNEELLRMRKTAFTEGMATSAEVIDAESLLAESRLACLAAYYAYDVALASLLAACGTIEQLDTYIE